MSLRQIIYTSRALGVFDKAAIHDLRCTCKRNNAVRDITGILLFTKGFFAQILEGESVILDEIFNKIQLDPRHFALRYLVDDQIEQRSCPDWSMAFYDLRTTAYSDFLKIENQLRAIRPGNRAAIERFLLHLTDVMPTA